MRTIFRFCTFLATFLLHLSLFSQQLAKKLDIPSGEFPDPYPGLPRPDKIGFLEFRPSNYNEVSKHPLIIFLHGAGERGNGVEDINSVATWGPPMYCAQANVNSTILGQFIVLSPQLSTSYGYWPTFYVKQMIEYAKANLKIDPDRIYLTGLSLGGGGVWRTITESATQASIFAAAAPVCGTYNGSPTNDENYILRDFCGTIGAAHLPIWNFHGMADNVVLPEQSQAAESKLKACSPPATPAPKFTYYQYNGHDAWNDAYSLDHITKEINENGVVSTVTFTQNLYEWFLSHTRSAASTPSCTTNTLPTNGSTINTSTTATLTWNAATGATSYDVYMWAGATASTTPKANVTTPSYDATGLSPATTYSWYVVPKNTTGSAIGCDANKTTFTTAANQLPVAIITPASKTITKPTNSVTLDGSASYNPAGGDITQYYWSLVSGPSSPTLSDNLLSSITVSNLDVGTYVFQLQVKNAAGIPNYATSTITVNETNQPPLFANPGSDDIVILPTSSYELDGSNSTPAEGIDQYYWSQKSGPNLVSWGDGNSQIGKKKVVSNLIKGEYTFELQVKKGNAVTWSYPLVKITAVERPVVNAGPDDIITLPTNTYTLNGTATTRQGTITEYYWLEDANNPSQVLNVSGHYDAQKVISNLVPGVYTFTLQAKNSYQVPNWRSVKITVKPAGSLRTSSTETKNPDPAVPTKGKLSLYPNPVRNTAVIELISADDRAKTINLYNATGVLKAKYTWQTKKGKNIFPLKNIPGLAAGLYVVDVRDANGKSVGNLRFIKL